MSSGVHIVAGVVEFVDYSEGNTQIGESSFDNSEMLSCSSFSVYGCRSKRRDSCCCCYEQCCAK